MYLPSLLTIGYWFSLFTDPFSRFFYWFLLILYLVFLVGAAAAGRQVIKLRDQDKFLKLAFQKVATFGYSFSLVGLLLLFFRQQQVQFFGMRIWAWTWWLVCLVWLVFIAKFLFIEFPRLKAERAKREQFRKYL
ncbi:MAG: hypothetical protein NTV81_02050 [Candidatus Komeilibacteria bacterium]|nr:hypothetical protein [Candidatus Komeilibacteria bacterium]